MLFRFRRRLTFGRPISLRFGRHARPTTRYSRHTFTGYPSNVRFYYYGNRSTNNRSNRGRLDYEVTAPEPDSSTLTVKDVDFKVASNTKAHHTDEYDMTKGRDPKLVVRRGQHFDIRVSLSKSYDPKTDDLRLIFEAGDRPQVSKGTQVEFNLSAEDKPKKWGAKILSAKDKEMTITVFTPPNCMVGKWELKIDVIKKGEGNVNRYRYSDEDSSFFYVIFNPWCKDDTVYLEKEELLNEYILNDSGRIFVGTHKQIAPRPWNFGQFEDHVLEVALYLMEAGGMSWNVRANPIAVVRKISALVNSSDDGGVLVGNWSGNYSGGTSPVQWTGSVPILEEYWKTKQSVAFGQCWVFSGVTTTILRALGIPARSVTNFQSAHDTDGSITIDYHFTAEGEADSNMDSDSVWNFHVWNECWLARPDLPQGYGGWQCVDATPQESSDNVYCCGPASVQAIKQGEVNMPFDGPFVFAEVNADTVYWRQTAEGYEPVNIKKKSVGKFISTKAVGSDKREDITNQYKPEEGSAAERAAVMKANQVGSNRPDIYKQGDEDVSFKIDEEGTNVWVGQDFKIGLAFENKSKENRTVSGRIVIKSMYYTGVLGDTIKVVPFSGVVVAPGKNSAKKLVISEKDYDERLVDGCMLDVSFWANVTETGQIFTEKEDYQLQKPHLTVKGPKEAVVGKEFSIEVSFTNPLNKTLTKCEVEVDGLSKPLKIPQGNIQAKSTFSTKVHITPKKGGHKELIVIFGSRQLDDVNVVHAVFVKNS